MTSLVSTLPGLICELAAACIELRLRGARSGVIDVIETAYGKVADDVSTEQQAEYECRYREQIERQSCPGCGETETY
jgi:hypothetical protein